jgi:proteasome lid subunit RPN8/RPN11
MADRTTVVLPKDVYNTISAWAEKAYPKEGVGLLIGNFSGPVKKVVRLAPLTNELVVKVIENAPTLPQNRQGQGAGGTEFVMSPSEFNRETLKAEKEGLDVVGVIHTHPDHPARPSQIDASQPFLAQWSNIIVSVEKGKTKDLKSWYRETDNIPFDEEEVKIAEI